MAHRKPSATSPARACSGLELAERARRVRLAGLSRRWREAEARGDREEADRIAADLDEPAGA